MFGPYTKYGRRDLWLIELVLAAVAVVLGLLAWYLFTGLWVLTAVAVLLMAFVASFFRDPPRAIPDSSSVLVSPADGRVQDIEELAADDPANALGLPALRIGIFLSVFDVHVNRSPCDGRVIRLNYWPGRFHDARDERSITENEANTVWIACADLGGSIAVKQIAGLIARRIVCEPVIGDQLARGQRFGMIKFGSRTELYVPIGAVTAVDVKVGQKVYGGQDILVRIRGYRE